MLRSGFVAASLLASACTFVYDADDLRKFDAPPVDAYIPDAEPPPDMMMPPDAMPVDSNPDNVMITGVTPLTVDEGVGADGGRPAIFEITGVDMIDGELTVTAAFTDGAMEQVPVEVLAVSVDEDTAALAIRIPVDPTIDSGETRTLRFTFSQGDVGLKEEDITVNGLDELTLTAGNKPVSELEPKYSQITVMGNVHFTGSTPAVLVATAGITLNARADVNASGQTPGPHGCMAGGANSAGTCGTAPTGGGGGAGFDAGALAIGTPGGGGGGGGFGEVGGVGAGQEAGPGGAMTGNDMLVPYVTGGVTPGNRGNGGGGGGNPSILGGGAAGPGGAGGGVLYLSAGGTLTITGGSLQASGGNGTGTGGGGGGGSGGGIIARAFGGIPTPPSNWITAAGGNGANSANDGGAGGAGRIRIDASGAIGTPGSNPVPKRGPAWDVASSTIVRVAAQMFTLYGEPGKMHGIRLNGTAINDVQIDFDGINEIPLTLATGLNTICALWDVNATSIIAQAEARSCIDVVYVP